MRSRDSFASWYALHHWGISACHKSSALLIVSKESWSWVSRRLLHDPPGVAHVDHVDGCASSLFPQWKVFPFCETRPSFTWCHRKLRLPRNSPLSWISSLLSSWAECGGTRRGWVWHQSTLPQAPEHPHPCCCSDSQFIRLWSAFRERFSFDPSLSKSTLCVSRWGQLLCGLLRVRWSHHRLSSGLAQSCGSLFVQSASRYHRTPFLWHRRSHCGPRWISAALFSSTPKRSLVVLRLSSASWDKFLAPCGWYSLLYLLLTSRSAPVWCQARSYACRNLVYYETWTVHCELHFRPSLLLPC